MDSKHSLTVTMDSKPCQVCIKLHSKGLFTEFLLLSSLGQAFKNKSQGILKDKKHSLKRRNIRTTLRQSVLGLSIPKFKITVINKLRALMGGKEQYARTDG